MPTPTTNTAQAGGEGSTPKRGRVFVRTVPNVMEAYGCSAEAAMLYMDFREEGHSAYVASVMAGIADPES